MPRKNPKSPLEKALTGKEKMFCQEYIVDFHGTRAAIAAGYSKKAARTLGTQILAKRYIRAHINQLLEQRRLKSDISKDELVHHLAEIAKADIRQVYDDKGDFDITKLDSAVSSLISEIHTETTYDKDGNPKYKQRVKLHDKLKATDLLGKFLGLVVEKHEVTGKDGKPIESKVETVTNDAIAQMSTDALLKLIESKNTNPK
jgi:phage terminase small subunit